MKTTGLLRNPSALLLGAFLTTGCNLLPLDFQDCLPDDESITLRVPGGADVSGPGGSLFQPLLGSTSEYHAHVVEISTLINTNVLDLVRRIRSIAAYPPSKSLGNTSTWGPYSPGGLDNLTYRFTAVKQDTAQYTIKLEARPSSSQAETDFVTLLDGELKGILGGQGGKGTGTFTIHLDARAALDANWLARGELAITYDSSADPRKIDVDLTGFDALADAEDDTAPQGMDTTYRYTESADHSGTFLFSIQLNVQDASLPAQETVALQSRWAADGRGRADSTIQGPDVAVQLQQVGATGQVIHATECWDTAFSLVFQDTAPEQLRAAIRPLEGDPTACAFTEADYPPVP